EASLQDPLLEQAAQLAQEGRLPRAVARDVLEEALWRWRSHPGLGFWDAQRTLIRDLLLSGSLAGTKYEPQVPLRDRYLPSGLGSVGTQDAFFDIGVQAFDFLNRPTLPIPSECRLR